jgi:phosphoglycerate dehydrogenase-like enzyme
LDGPIKLLVLSNPAADHLRLLDRLQEPVDILVGDDPEFAAAHGAGAEVIFTGNSEGDLLRMIFPLAQRVRWVHSMSAGVEKILFPELVESPVPLTNGKGAFSTALAEFAISSILSFAKDLRRLVRNQQAGEWKQFDIELIRGQVLGIVGYGDIGRESARLARAFGMRIVAVRRRRPLSSQYPDLERTYTPDGLREMLAICDYVLVTTPLTPETRGMIGEAELGVMKPSAMIINLGRGPVIVERDLIAALTAKRIRGAALDVFDEEPLPEGHPFYGLENVLLSPHSADHTVGWADLAMHVFIENFERFRSGQPLQNIVDKKAGY